MIESERIIRDLFVSIQNYVRDEVATSPSQIGALYNLRIAAWEKPKEYKGNSSQMGFISEYAVFELVRQVIERNKKIEFKPRRRTKIGDGRTETNYFVDDVDCPTVLLSQGLKINQSANDELKLPSIPKQHDLLWLERNTSRDEWKVRAVFEIKNYFDSPSLQDDLERLKFAEEKYPLESRYALVFVGFRKRGTLSKKEMGMIEEFSTNSNRFVILPEQNKDIRPLKDFRDVFDRHIFDD